MTTTEFILVRHGETVWHADNRYAGRADVALTERGRRQAEELGTWAAGQRIHAVYHSPLSRARLTAEPAARALGLELREDPRLLELDFGRGEGLSIDEMRTAFPEELAKFVLRPVTDHLPGGNDPREAARQARQLLDEIVAEHLGGRVLIVAHNALYRVLLCELLGIDPDEYRRVFPVLDNGTLTEIRIGDGQASLIRFNAPYAPVGH